MTTRVQANLLVDKDIYDKFRMKMIETNHSRRYAEVIEKLMLLYVQNGNDLFNLLIKKEVK